MTTGFDWTRYLQVLHRFRWPILGVTLLGAAGGVALAFLAQPGYVAEATLWIDMQGETREAGAAGPGELLQAPDWVDLLRSYAVLEPVVRERGLFVLPEDPDDADVFRELDLAQTGFRPGDYALRVDDEGRFALRHGDSIVVDRGPVGAPVGAPVGVRWTPGPEELRPGRVLRFTLMHPRDAARDLREGLSARILEQGSILRVELRGSNTEETASTLSAVVTRYKDVAEELRRGKLEEARGQLEEQLRSAEVRLRAAEDTLEEFRTRTIAASVGAGAGVESSRGEYSGLAADLEALRRDRRLLESMLADSAAEDLLFRLESVPTAEGSGQLGAALEELAEKRASLEVLRRDRTEAHPAVVSLREDIRRFAEDTIPHLAEELAGALRASEEALAEVVEEEEEEEVRDLRALPAREAEEVRLSRNVTIAANLYTAVKEELEGVRLASAGTVSQVRILDTPEAGPRPVDDPRARLVLLALLGSFGLAVMGALLHDRFDTRVRYPDQLTRDFGLPILGTMPDLGNGRGPKALPAALASTTVEAFRALRVNVSYAHGSAGPIAITITSASPREGKSFVSANLAVGFARAGYRTLLLDGDVRRGELDRLLDRNRKPGLTEFLSGEAAGPASPESVGRIIQTTSVPRLFFIASGRRSADVVEALPGPEMRDLMARLRREFDAIVVDTPPLVGGVEPLLFSVLTGNALLVLRAGSTQRGVVEAKIRQFDRLPVRILGGVLNDLPTSGPSAYVDYSYYPYDSLDEGEGQVTERGPLLLSS